MFLYLAADAALSDRGQAERLGAPSLFVSINKNSMVVFLAVCRAEAASRDDAEHSFRQIS